MTHGDIPLDERATHLRRDTADKSFSYLYPPGPVRPLIHRAAAIAFALWGLLHAVLGSIFLALSLWGPADAFAADGIPADTSAHARALMMQNNVSLIAGGLTVFVLAVRLGWQGSRPTFGVMLGVSTLFFFELVAFEVIPGHLTLAQAAPSIATWTLGAVLGIAALARVDSRDQSSAPV